MRRSGLLGDTGPAALDAYWYEGQPLTPSERSRLEVVFSQHSFGVSNFNVWLSHTLKQIEASARTEGGSSSAPVAPRSLESQPGPFTQFYLDRIRAGAR